MKSGEDKSRQQQLKREFKKKEEEVFAACLPMQIGSFLNLFDELNERLSEEPCDHTLTITEDFLNQHQLPVQKVIPWLKEHGGYCDCEVLFNIEKKFEDM